jgi:hypothetical protein
MRLCQRIARADGWLSRPTTTVKNLKADWERIMQTVKDHQRNESEVTFAHLNFFYLSKSKNQKEALEEQKPIYEKFFGYTKPWSYSQGVYMTGAADEIRQKIYLLKDIGVEYIILHPLMPDSNQLTMLKDEIVSRV